MLSEPEADDYAVAYQRLLQQATSTYAEMAQAELPRTCGPRANLSVKPTALTPRFDPLCFERTLKETVQRLHALVERAPAQAATVNLDMEQFEVRDLTLALAKRLLESTPGLQLGIVMQAYLRDAETVTGELIDWLLAHGLRLTVRLVKGAYWDFEVAQAEARHWPVPVYEEKAATDAAFERLTVRLLGAFPHVTTAIGSHNVRSIAHAMAVAEALGRAPHEIEFQLLYGMGEALHAAIAARGYPVRIYTPVGELIPGMSYLVRRLIENTANESFLRHDFLNEDSVDELLAPPVLAPANHDGSPTGTQQWRGEPTRDFARHTARMQMANALSATRGEYGRRYPLLLGDGEVATDTILTVRNPAARGQVLGEVTLARMRDVDRAVDIAIAAQQRWERTPAAERIACLRRAASLLRQQRDQLAAWEIHEEGKSWREADADLVESIDYLEYYAKQMAQLAAGKPLRQAPGERNTYIYQPRGVSVVIAPWNFPLAIATGMTSAALVTGNAVIFKPAEQSSILGYYLVRTLRAAGVPAGALQYVPGAGETIGAALVADHRVAQILFTGSRAVGLAILQQAARVEQGQRFVKHVVVEMGGKNALIIDADADLDAAVAGTLTSAFGYGGQKCSAASRLIVHEAVAERVLARLAAAASRLVVADPADPCTDLGPLIDAAAQQRVQTAATTAASAGTILFRYPESRLPVGGNFVSPMIVTDISPDIRWRVRSCSDRSSTYSVCAVSPTRSRWPTTRATR